MDIFWGIKNWAKATFSTILQPSASNEKHLNTCMAWLNAAAMSLLCIYGNVFKFPNTSYTGVLVDSDWSRFSMKHDLRIVPKKENNFIMQHAKVLHFIGETHNKLQSMLFLSKRNLSNSRPRFQLLSLNVQLQKNQKLCWLFGPLLDLWRQKFIWLRKRRMFWLIACLVIAPSITDGNFQRVAIMASQT